LSGGQDFEYDIAITYAGENRAYVQWVAERLRDRDVSVFYDRFNAATMWGEDLPVFLDEVFRKKARWALVFVSRDYIEKVWTGHERESVIARQIQGVTAYVLAVKLDDSELPGYQPTRGYIDAREVGRDGLVDLIFEKLNAERTIDRVPRSQAEEDLLLKMRPGGWEFLLFAAELQRQLTALDPRWRDHEMRLRGQSTAGRLDDSAANEMIQTIFPRSTQLLDNFNRILSPESTQAAFGPPGTPGDDARIRHLAERLVDVYRDMLDVSATLRSAMVSDPFQPLFDVASRFFDQPIREVREFVGTVMNEMDALPAKLAQENSEPIKMTLTLTLTMEDGLIEEFSARLQELELALDVDGL
jgi:hypothetical protein